LLALLKALLQALRRRRLQPLCSPFLRRVRQTLRLVLVLPVL